MLSWRLSNTHDARFCTDPLTEALERYTDQGNQFPSLESTATLKDAGVAISMGGRGRCMDNIFIERALALACVRSRQTARTLRWLPSPTGHRPMDTVSQYRIASLRPGRLHPARTLRQRNAAGEAG